MRSAGVEQAAEFWSHVAPAPHPTAEKARSPMQADNPSEPFPGTPEELMSRFGEYVRAGALERLVSLYESKAVFTPEPGVVHSGRAAIQSALAGLLGLQPSMTTRVIEVHEADDIALVIVDWELRGTAPDGTAVTRGGRSADVLRRQSDATWRVLIDHP
jgi:uncharacterized protein (TIGR02246 family)